MTSETVVEGQQPQAGNEQHGGDASAEKPAATDTQQGDSQAADGKATGPSSPSKKAPKPEVHKVDYEPEVVYLYQFSRCPTLPSASPFCLKVETFLRLAEIKYENVDHKMKYKSKKGQLPFVELNGREIADSDIIVKELSQHFNKDLDANLSAEQKTVSHAMESMLNNHTSWVVRWWRYNNPAEFLKASQMDMKRTLNSRLPNSLLNVLFRIGFKSNVKMVVGHGIGHHTTEEIYDFGKSDLKALSELLGTKDYFFGTEPHLLDITAFAHLCQFLYIPFGGMKEWMETETPNLVALVDRIKNRAFPDWDEMCKTLDLNTHLPKPPEPEKEPEDKDKPAGEGEEANNKTEGAGDADAKKEEEAKKAEEEAKKEEKRRKEEEKKKEKEEKKRQKEEQKKKEKEEKERKKKEEKERKEREKKEKEEKEKAEKEAAEKKKQEEEAAAKAAEGAAAETKPAESSEAPKTESQGGGDAPADDSK